jgi:hypothetical protein
MDASIGLSLKAYSPDLARYLALSPVVVYERQRALVSLGMLPKAPRGPHIGVRATPDSVAALVIAVLATDSPADHRVVALLKAKPSEAQAADDAATALAAHQASAARQLKALGSKVPAPRPAERPKARPCPITGAGNFRDAVAAVLASEALAADVAAITVDRSAGIGAIVTTRRVSRFGRITARPPQLAVEARLPGELIRQIVVDLELHRTVKVFGEDSD